MSAQLPREPRAGDRIEADWARAVARAIRSQRVVGGPGVIVSSGPDGTTVSVPRRPKARAAASAAGSAAVLVSATVSAGASGGVQCTVYGDGPHNPSTGSGILYFADVAMGSGVAGGTHWFVGFPGLVFETGGSEA